MKKLIYCAAALATALFAGSCQQELLDTTAKETTVTYTVALPDAQTKAIGDAANVDQLIYEVWKTEVAGDTTLTNPATNAVRLYQDEAPLVQRNGKTCAIVTFNLVQDQEYTILFWAQNSNGHAYNTENLTHVTYAEGYSENDEFYLSNVEEYAAFYAVDFVSDGDPKNKTVILTRPFAQLNLGTLNTADKYTVTMVESEVTVTDVPTGFNVAAKQALGEGDVVFNYNAVPNNPKVIDVNNVTYQYAAMNYLFADANRRTTTVTYNINSTLTSDAGEGAVTENVVVNNTIDYVPYTENYRTNIVGNLLTSTTQYEVIIDAEFNTPDDVVEAWNGSEVNMPKKNDKGQYEIEYPSQLAWLAAAVNGTLVEVDANGNEVRKDPVTFEKETFVLIKDIDLNNLLWTPIGATGTFKGSFNGQNHTIYNLKVKADDKTPIGLFSAAKYVSNLKVENAVIEGHYKAGVIVGDGLCSRIENCHVTNAVVTVAPLNKDDGNQAGGIVGYLSGESEAYVKGCSVTDAVITAYRDVAGIAGTANQTAVITGNRLVNVTVIADHTAEYTAKKAVNAGIVAGRVNTKATITENEVDEVSTVTIKVNTAESLQRALDTEFAGTTNILFTENITGDVTALQKEGVNLVINGDEKKFDGVITVNGNARAEGEETLTFKNINFETEGEDFTFITAPSKIDNKYNYSHNVTIEGCTFTGNQTVGSANLTGTYNFVMKGCQATNMHSLLQIQSCDNNVTIENVKTVNCKSGISLGNVANGSIKNAEISAAGYGLRLDGAKERTVSVTVENSSIEAFIPVSVRKLNNAECNVEIEFIGENTVEGQVYDVAFCSNEYENGVDPLAPVGTYSLKGIKGLEVYYGSMNSKSAFAVSLANTLEPEVKVEANIENVGMGFEVNHDVVLNFDGKELNAGSTASSTWYAIEATGEETDVEINDAYFTRAGVWAGEGANVVFNSGVINHKPERTSRYIFCAQSGSTITVNDGTFTNDRAKNSFFWADDATIYVNGGNFGGVASNNKVVLTNGGQLIITGGTFNFDPTAYLPNDEYVVKYENGVYTVSSIYTPIYWDEAQTQVVKGAVIVDENTFAISSAEGLTWFANQLDGTSARDASKVYEVNGKKINLLQDVDLTGVTTNGDSFGPIGRYCSGQGVSQPFTGHFDGQGHTIKGIYQSGWDFGYEWGTTGYLGLFGYVVDATIENLTIEGMESVVEGGTLGAVAGRADGSCVFKNITVKNTKLGTYNNRCGGIVGWTGYYTNEETGETVCDFVFENINICDDVVLGGLWGSFDSSIGGVMGQLNSGVTSCLLKNVTVSCRIDAYNDCTASYDYYLYRMCGMIIGQMSKTTTIDGSTYPDVAAYGIQFDNVTVNYGKWMNYHYCEPTPGLNGGRGMRVEAGFTYDGLPADYDHTQCVDNHYNCIPFDQLFGGVQTACKGVKAWDGVTVNYPAEYTCELCGEKHNVK